ncbi:MAG: FAD-dependent urate hydroxylase HpxO [Roseofilum sp. SBFL]|uniref:FAD-dependent urate hydroxylase HpxO n=1 Tax=unclassified Roseofilum TaxID=2620099 RepID=UPI001B0D14C7|nr:MULTISPECIES: FAD-dependent urate hydroxylase HpxO [unclassified Roseofilum]MBP0036306.1 FAD-dependent urate hydroxylase HpxO [Roseofilum sp. SID1]MBP0044887.1 FAD-dependent urate hydroxylase HpxO [Roseofilum sp. SBFL]
MYDLKAIIIGGGIGGLTAGIALKQAGYEIEIYDRVREFRPAGAGISLWSNGIKVLNSLGLAEEMIKIGGRMNRMEYRSHQDTLFNAIDLHPLIAQVGQRPYPVSRTELQALLLQTVGEENVTLNCNCVSVAEDENGVTASFEDGRTTRGDLLIAADGIHSMIRPLVTGESSEPRYAGYVNWNGIVEAEAQEIDPDCWVIYVGEGKRASLMPIGGERFYFFFGCPMEKGTGVTPENRQQELADIFRGWANPVQTLIQTLNPLATNRLEIHDLNPLKTLVKGRIALLGDAGHATTPTLGQGGCQAMEDAAVLCRYLITTNISVADALKRYEVARKTRTAELVLKARKRTDTIYGKDMMVTRNWYDSLSQESASDVINALAKVILGGPFN